MEVTRLPPPEKGIRPAPQQEDEGKWEWTLPDLEEDGLWFKEQLANLEKAIENQPNRLQLRRLGLQTLRRYVTTLQGGKATLNLLWWEWPPSYRKQTREGCSMNFLSTPPPGLVDNPPMTPEQLETAVEFVDELISLGVLEPVPKGRKILRNGPLLVIPKEGQPGQWRVLSDMKRGGQNEFIAAEPVNLPRLDGILPSLSPGGYSAIVDVSKCFYHFPTREQERPYLSLIHPKTGQHLWYAGLPMGSRSSPGISGQGLAAILRVLAEHPMFQGKVHVNCVTNHLVNVPYHPEWPEG